MKQESTRRICIVMLLVAGCIPVVSTAHHSFAEFDRGQRLSLTGTVKSFEFTNPHSWIRLLVKNGNGGGDEWSIEAFSPNVLMRTGWKKSSLQAGQEVTVVINPVRNGAHGGNLVSVTLPNGDTLLGGGE